jgi:hypothetical protein
VENRNAIAIMKRNRRLKPAATHNLKDILRVSKLNLINQENLPSPLFAKEGDNPSLWKREVRRDFITLSSLL